MKEQIKQGKFAIADLSFHIYPDYRGVLSLFQVKKPKNSFITRQLPLPEAPNTDRADLYFKDKSIRAIRFTLTFQDRLSGEIDVTELIEAIQQYSKYPDSKKAYLQGVVCLLYTSDAADDLLCVDLGGRRIIKKKKQKQIKTQ